MSRHYWTVDKTKEVEKLEEWFRWAAEEDGCGPKISAWLRMLGIKRYKQLKRVRK
jgi:hypothetical protein